MRKMLMKISLMHGWSAKTVRRVWQRGATHRAQRPKMMLSSIFRLVESWRFQIMGIGRMVIAMSMIKPHAAIDTR